MVITNSITNSITIVLFEPNVNFLKSPTVVIHLDAGLEASTIRICCYVFHEPSCAVGISMRGMIKVDQGATTMLYRYLSCDECVIVRDACDGVDLSIFAATVACKFILVEIRTQ